MDYQVSSSATHESALRRPGEAPSNSSYEPPLQRPNPPPASVSFRDAEVAFAVDTSGSTAGLVLQHEKLALETITGQMKAGVQEKSIIVPWNSNTSRNVRLDAIDSLVSSGGTRPSVLLSNDHSRKALLDSQMWFLFTDGEISDTEVGIFAQSIDEHILHNKACVCILFGYRVVSPSRCNISVGMSIYGMVPDSLFLFHDIDTAEVFVLLAKGCFAHLGRTDLYNTTIDDTTRWSELPRIEYSDLAWSTVPLPRELDRNEILLQNGNRLNLNRFAENSLAPQEVDHILSSPNDLSAVVASMKTLGKSNEFLAWTEQQSRDSTERQTPRFDHAHAEALVKEILFAMRNNKGATEIKHLQEKLRKAHLLNWKPLLEGQDYENRRNQSLQLLSSRMTSMGDTEISSSASMLTPLQSPMSVALSAQHDTDDYACQSQPPHSHAFHLRQPPRQELSADRGGSALAIDAIERLRKTATFCPGLEIKQPFPLRSRPYLLCLICGEETPHLALLLKQSPSEHTTEGFPPPSSVCEVMYPLALARYRETDIISQTCCCEVCAYWIARSQDSIYDEKIVAALPIAPQLSNPDNQKYWVDTLYKVFAGRFQRRNLLAIALAIFTDAAAQLRDGSLKRNNALQTALEHVNTQLQRQCEISFGGGSGNIANAFYYYQSVDLMDFSNEIYRHPLDSFAVILGTVERHNRNSKMIAGVMFRRLALLLFENVASAASRQTDVAFLQQSYLDPLQKQPHNADLHTSIDDLVQYAFIPPSDLRALRMTGLAWRYVEMNGRQAIHEFLVQLAKEDLTAVGHPAQRLNEWLSDPGVGTCLSDPIRVLE